MADSTQNSSSKTTVHITIESDENTENEAAEKKNGIQSKDENRKSSLETSNSASCSDKFKDPVLRPSSFLRPSALSGGALKASSTANSSASVPKLNISGNKFACPDSSVESLFSIPTSSEKKESKPVLPATVSIPAPTPLSNPDYVFGQNLLARVAERSESVSNGTNSMLFSSVLSGEGGSEPNSSIPEAKESSSLLEDAARCQEQRAQKRKYEEVLVTTGEEDEKNVVQFVVKLFAFEGGSWVERGRGNLRVNDASGGGSGSRIVFRTMGSLRVVLNTKIWADMELTRASEKSIRLTALDAAGQLKIFLIQASPADMTTLYNCLESRVRRCQIEEKARRGSSLNDEVDGGKAVEGKGESPRPPKEPVLDISS